MGSITDQVNTAFRDFVTDGVASSGPHEVVKSDVRAIGPLIESAMAAAGLGALVSVVKATRADLNADLAHAANSVALVYADATDANNDLYVKVGASGSGSWTLTTSLHDTIEGAAQPFVDAATAEADRAQEIRDALELMLKIVSARSGYLVPFGDADDNELGGFKTDTSFWTALTGNVDAAIAALQNSGIPIKISIYAGYLIAFADLEDNFLFGVDDTGDFWVQSFNLTEYMREGGIGDGIATALYPTDDIGWYGDSLTENWASKSATLLAALAAAGDTKARTITAAGLGGQTAAQILGRQGGRPALVTFPNDANGVPEMPASGAASVTLNTAILNHPGSGNVEQQTATGVIQFNGGIAGTLTRIAGGTSYTFTRADSGSAIKLPPKVPFIPSNEVQRRKVGICWIGTNDLIAGTAAATIFAAIEDYVRGQLTLEKRTVIFMPTWVFGTGDTARRAIYDELWSLLVPKYGGWLIDTIGTLAPHHNGGATDLGDVAAGLIPRSLMNGDRTHFPDGGTAYAKLADQIALTILRNGA